METTQPIKFSNSFTPLVEEYTKVTNSPTVKGFAQTIHVTEETIWAWANKKKKDENGNVTDELARPNFFAVVSQLNSLKDIQKPVEVVKEEPKAEEKSTQDLLNAKQELFCQLYATDREFFGNGVQTYIEVYEPDKRKANWYNTARASASQILSNINVCKRINELLSDEGLNDAFVDKQLLFIIAQHDDKSAKVAAIREYNKLKQRITEKMDHTTLGKAMPTPIYGGKSSE